MERALEGLAALRARADARRRRAAIASTIPAGTRRSTSTTCSTVSEAVTRSALERNESRGGHFREDYPQGRRARARWTSWCKQGAGRCDAGRADPVPPLPPELQRIIEEMK